MRHSNGTDLPISQLLVKDKLERPSLFHIAMHYTFTFTIYLYYKYLEKNIIFMQIHTKAIFLNTVCLLTMNLENAQ